MTSASSANLLGALALAVTDAQTEAMREATGLGTSAVAALVTLGASPGETIGALSRVLELTHSVTVRLVEGLVEAGLVGRSPGQDRRQVRLTLTSEGMVMRGRALRARDATLAELLTKLPEQDVERFSASLSGLLEALTLSRRHGDHICRLCHEEACANPCPVEQQSVRLEGPRP